MRAAARSASALALQANHGPLAGIWWVDDAVIVPQAASWQWDAVTNQVILESDPPPPGATVSVQYVPAGA